MLWLLQSVRDDTSTHVVMHHGSSSTCCLLATRLSPVAKAELKLPGSREEPRGPLDLEFPPDFITYQQEKRGKVSGFVVYTNKAI